MAEDYEEEQEFTDRQLLADFIATVHDDLDTVIWLRGDVFPVEFAPNPDLRVRTLEAMGRAWADVQPTVPVLIEQVLDSSNAGRLREAGLTGDQLAFKLSVWEESRAALVAAFEDPDDSDDGEIPIRPPQVRPSYVPQAHPELSRRQPKWLKWALDKLRKAFADADTLLESVAGALGVGEAFTELKTAVENLAGESADDVPDEPG